MPTVTTTATRTANKSSPVKALEAALRGPVVEGEDGEGLLLLPIRGVEVALWEGVAAVSPRGELIVSALIVLTPLPPPVAATVPFIRGLVEERLFPTKVLPVSLGL